MATQIANNKMASNTHIMSNTYICATKPSNFLIRFLLLFAGLFLQLSYPSFGQDMKFWEKVEEKIDSKKFSEAHILLTKTCASISLDFDRLDHRPFLDISSQIQMGIITQKKFLSEVAKKTVSLDSMLKSYRSPLDSVRFQQSYLKLAEYIDMYSDWLDPESTEMVAYQQLKLETNNWLSNLPPWNYQMLKGTHFSGEKEYYNENKTVFQSLQKNDTPVTFYDLCQKIKTAFLECRFGMAKLFSLPGGGIVLVSEEKQAYQSNYTLLMPYVNNPYESDLYEIKVRLIVFLSNAPIPPGDSPFSDIIDYVNSGTFKKPEGLSNDKEMMFFNKDTGKCTVRVIVHKHSFLEMNNPSVLPLKPIYEDPEQHLGILGFLRHLK